LFPQQQQVAGPAKVFPVSTSSTALLKFLSLFGFLFFALFGVFGREKGIKFWAKCQSSTAKVQKCLAFV